MSKNYVKTGYRKAWVMFDLSNGDPNKGGYMWIFPTRREARLHKQLQSKAETPAELSTPILISL